MHKQHKSITLHILLCTCNGHQSVCLVTENVCGFASFINVVFSQSNITVVPETSYLVCVIVLRYILVYLQNNVH